MSLRERIEKWWDEGSPVTLFVGLWIMMMVSASLFNVILTEIP